MIDIDNKLRNEALTERSLMNEENKTEVGQGTPDKTVHMINGTFVLLPFDVVRHIKELESYKDEWQVIAGKANLKGLVAKNDALELQVKELEKERAEMKEALIEYHEAINGRMEGDYYVEEFEKKYAKLIEKLKGEE